MMRFWNALRMVIRCLRYAKTKIIRVVAWYIEGRIGPRLCGALQSGGKLREEFILDEILIIADDESKDHNNSAVYRANCRIKTRQWLLSIFNPERFANYSRQDVKHEGAQGMQPVINVTYSGNKPEIAPEAGIALQSQATEILYGGRWVGAPSLRAANYVVRPDYRLARYLFGVNCGFRKEPPSRGLSGFYQMLAPWGKPSGWLKLLRERLDFWKWIKPFSCVTVKMRMTFTNTCGNAR